VLDPCWKTLGLSSITVGADTRVLPEVARQSAGDVAALSRRGDSFVC